MKPNKFGIFMCLMLVSTMLLGASSFNSVGATENSVASQTKTITATGTAEVTATPDVAYVNAGVLVENTDLSKAQSAAKEKMNKVMAALKELGIADADIKTTNYSVNPKYTWSDKTGESKITGYTVSHAIEIRVNDISKAGKVLDTVVANGSNDVNGVRFGLKDETTLYNQALESAVKNAKAKATAMGKGLNITNLTPIKITELSNVGDVVYYENFAMDKAATNSSTVPVSAGDLKIQASVSVDFGF